MVRTAEHVKSMSDAPIILAMANPIPEIMPDVAKAAGAAVIGTGRSDFPNQVNNVLAFPRVAGTPKSKGCLLYTSPSPRDLSTSRMPSSA